MSRLNKSAVLAIVLALFAQRAAAEKLPVVASFSILADLVKVVGGERVAVTSLVGPDADAHVFDPTPKDAVRIARARLVVVNGLGFEGWQQRLLQAARYQGEVVVASTGVRPRGHEHQGEHAQGHEHGHLDPHAWQDPQNVMLYVANIAAALARVDPKGAATYRANAASYQVVLRELDAWAGARFARIPVSRRRAVTAHAAFDYLAARYGLRLSALQTLSTESEPSARAMGELVRRMRADGTAAVFAENLHNARLLRQLAGEAGVTVGGKLYSDALSAPRGPAPTYLALMRYNVDQLARGMQGNPR
ncbi:metal ABC transporter substrate-binding protein [Janthinobacterium sp. J1-1]|uniref:metal ABC transporter substrate-binding protein n=1 Tax=unclassified Janthinobacterium TaxID=2610881 RepID=UPI0028123EF1|nr:metal ABC transporter substrate-binding protein [Janthinobacterium sp. J1-1]